MHATGEGEAKSRWSTLAGRSGLALFGRWRRRLLSARWPTRGEMRAWLAAEIETETKARSSFFLVPIGLMIGIAIVDGANFRMGLLPALGLALPMLVLARHLGGRGIAGVSVLLLAFVCAGMALAAAELRLTTTTIFSGEATVRIEGRVTWGDRDDRDRMRYLVRIDRTERPVLSRPPKVVAILVSSRHEPIPVGGRFAGLVRLRAPSGPAYPGAYDFAFAPFFEGRGANGFSLGPPEPPGTAVLDPTVGERLVGLRLAMSDRIREVIGGGAGAVASALITGERSGIPDDINDWLRATGLSHVLSISGLHMALVAGFAMVLVRGLIAAIPGAALVLPTKKIAAVAALLVATGYLVISGSDVATDRSYVMLAIMLVAILVDRPALTLRNVAIAAIVVMLTTPHAVVTASFQMSFSATAALVGVYGALTKRAASRQGRSKRNHPLIALLIFLGGLAASSAIAGAATAPFAAYHFQRIAPYGVIANLIAVPIFSFWIMPLALIAALAMPFGLDAPFLILVGWGLDLVFALAKILAAHFPDAPSGRLTQTGLLIVTAALLLACLPAGRLRWAALPAAVLGLLLLPDRGTKPDLLVFEDGREIATIDSDDQLQSLRRRPNDFVLDQWHRAFAAGAVDPGSPEKAGRSDTRKTGAEATIPNQTPEAGPSRTSTPPQAEQTRLARATEAASYEPTASQRPTSPSTAFVCEDSPLPPEVSESAAADQSSKRSDTGPSDKHVEASTSAIADLDKVEPSTLAIDAAADKTASAVLRAERDTLSSPDARPPVPNAAASASPIPPKRKPPPPRQLCRATTRNGLRIAWTDDYRLTGTVCDTADIAIVARAIALRRCRSGARLITLRTLRESGSLAIYGRSRNVLPLIEISITDPGAPWNHHRSAPWPESWKNPDTHDTPERPNPPSSLPGPTP